MMPDKKEENSQIQANDDVSHNAHYDNEGKPSQLDERDKKDSTEDWDAEKSKTGRHK